MQKLDFGEKLDLIVEQDSRYDREAYHFLRDALDYTVKQRKKAKEGGDHVTGQQLLDGIRQFAIKEYGPMVPTVLGYWGVRRCEDFGEMVYNFIREGISERPRPIPSSTSTAVTAFTRPLSCPICRKKHPPAARPAKLRKNCIDRRRPFPAGRSLCSMMSQSYSTGSEAARSFSYPAVNARTWTLPNGLGVIVQEDQQRPGGQRAGLDRDGQHP